MRMNQLVYVCVRCVFIVPVQLSDVKLLLASLTGFVAVPVKLLSLGK